MTRFLRPLRRALGYVAAAAAILSLAPSLALAQSWPAKPVSIVVPFPAGGGTDAFARPLFATLTKQTGKQFVIDNKGGAGGTLGAGVAARAAPEATHFSWARCTTRLHLQCTRSSTTTSRKTSSPWR